MPDMARQAVHNITRDATFLRHLSGHQMTVTGPSPKAVSDGIASRWKQLSGSIERLPFTLEQANLALSRIIDKTPPCGENNEQFRDCCIWECALSLAAERPLHFVTSDHAFYDGRKSANGLAKVLRSEVECRNGELYVYPTIQDLLNALGDTVVAIDEAAIAAAILDSVTPEARGIAAERGPFELSQPLGWRIKGYTTPKEALIAVSYDIFFELNRVGPAGVTGEEEKALLTMRGSATSIRTRTASRGSK
jgi:hypothetical protein